MRPSAKQGLQIEWRRVSQSRQDRAGRLTVDEVAPWPESSVRIWMQAGSVGPTSSAGNPTARFRARTHSPWRSPGILSDEPPAAYYKS